MRKNQMTLDDITNEAIDRVDRNADEEWKREAYEMVCVACSRYTEFTTDTIWSMLARTSLTTHEPRAMGAIMRKAQRDGLIKATGQYTTSTRPECHKRPVMIWEPTA